jgi:hypothetical protein
MKKKSQKGFALVLVLSAVVLLTITVLAFYSNSIMQTQISRSSANIIKADEFAAGAYNLVISALKEEIFAGSTVEHEIFYPSTITNAVPALAASTGANGLQNLLKVSSSTAPFRPGGSVVASAISTTSSNSSLDGRHIPAARWNAPLLMPPTSLNDLTPDSSDFAPPEWIYVSRNGTNPTSWNNSLRWSASDNSTVIGRYAFAVYNVGGLLDANLAGYPSQVTNSVATERQIAYKSASVFADLTRIGFTQDKIDQLVNWRNAATFSNNATRYLNAVESNTNGFLTTAHTNLVENQSDRQFTSRQQLIDFVRNKLRGNADLDTLKSLQYLTPFSRSLEQPSFRPNPARPRVESGTAVPANYTGGNHAYGFDDQINPPFLKARVASIFTRRDGTPAKVGEPLVKKRFPLECLSWITCRGPSASRKFLDPDMVSLLSNPGVTEELLRRGTPENIRNYFGLVWDSSDNLWNYAPGVYGASVSASPVSGSIARLENITNRDPNFIELLKASIHVGSLGKVSSSGTGSGSYPFNKFTSTDYHTIQIAANILGQVKADGYPLRIRFTAAAAPGPMLFASSQNLPYLYRWRHISVFTHLPDPLPPYPKQQPMNSPGQGVHLIVPEIWNPYDPNTTVSPMRPGPAELRVVMDNSIVSAIAPSQAVGNGLNGPERMTAYNFLNGSSSSTSNLTSSPPSRSTPENSALEFGDANGMLFREPTALRNPGVPAGSNLTTGVNHRLRGDTDDWCVPNLQITYSPIDSNGGIRDFVFHGGSAASAPSIIGIFVGSFPLIEEKVIYLNSGPLVAASGSYIFCADAKLSASPATDNKTLSAYSPWTRSLLTSVPTSAATYQQQTYRMQCRDPFGNWIDYDTKEWAAGMDATSAPHSAVNGSRGISAGSNWNPLRVNHGGLTLATNATASYNATVMRLTGKTSGHYYSNDPRTRRFGLNTNFRDINTGVNPPDLNPDGISVYSTSNSYFPATLNNSNVLATTRFSYNQFNSGWDPEIVDRAEKAWYRGNSSGGDATGFTISGSGGMRLGEHSERLCAQNNPDSLDDNVAAHYSDSDGIVRRAMGAYTPLNSSASTSSNDGLPTTTATAGWDTSSPTPTSQSQSRPTILHRPFRSVAELGYVFRDIPWKNLDFFTPESGDSALLDVFCIRETESDVPIVAGKVDLNTRQPQVLEALIAGGLIDEHLRSGTSMVPLSNASISADATNISLALVHRTSAAPFTNIAELVGRYDAASGQYDGFSEDLTGLFSQPAHNVIQRFREAPIRVLSNTGQIRVWNLLIDVVAQTGKFPVSASGMEQFVVEAESRKWVHIAIDRLTGEVLDMQVETVTE